MKKLKLVVALLIPFLSTGIALAHVSHGRGSVPHHKTHDSPHQVAKHHQTVKQHHQISKVKPSSKSEDSDMDTTRDTDTPYQVTVQVTAYASHSRHATFANGKRAHRMYALQGHSLPEGEVVYAAFSSKVKKQLHANLNDYFVIVHKQSHQTRVLKFVDMVSASEHRPVVDLYFSNSHQAALWGRQTGYCVMNFSAMEIE